jgi:hypothetical protein
MIYPDIGRRWRCHGTFPTASLHVHAALRRAVIAAGHADVGLAVGLRI